MKLQTLLSALRECDQTPRFSIAHDKLERRIVEIMDESGSREFDKGWNIKQGIIGELSSLFFLERQSDQITPQTWNDFKKEVLGE